MEDGAGLDPVAVALRAEDLRAEGVSEARSTLRFLFAGAAAVAVVFFFCCYGMSLYSGYLERKLDTENKFQKK